MLNLVTSGRLLVARSEAIATFGGPETTKNSATIALAATYAIQEVEIVDDFSIGNPVIEDKAALAPPVSPLGDAFAARDGVLTYTVQKGDTLLRIAASFGISLDTLLGTNPKVNANKLQVGEELIVLPVTGYTYVVAEGDTLDSIAAGEGKNPADILAVNQDFLSGPLIPGRLIIIPGARPRSYAGRSGASLIEFKGAVPPTTGWNWGRLHDRNAVDIANVCGTPIYTAYEGLVVDIGNPDEWNGGYGGFVKIQHYLGGEREVETLYAHLEQVLVGLGDQVARREEVGKMGSTGNTHGPTGCHLHFEVRSSDGDRVRNPLAKYY